MTLLSDSPRASRAGAVRWGRVLGSEWTKLRSLRAFWVIAAAGVLGSLTVTLLSCRTVVEKWDQRGPAQRAAFDPVGASFTGFVLLQLAMVVAGSLAMSHEFSSGLVRTSFLAVPRRYPVVLAKAAVAGATALVLGLATALTGFVAAQAMFSARHVGVPVTRTGVPGALLATGVHLASVTLVALAVAGVVRHAAGAMGTVFALLFVLPPFLRSDHGWMVRLYRSLPATALRRLTVAHLESGAPSAAAAWTCLVVLPVLLLAVAVLVTVRRDV